MINTFKYKLKPTKKQKEALSSVLEEQRILYNAALTERNDCYKKTKKGISYVNQLLNGVSLMKKPDQYLLIFNVGRLIN